MAEKQLPLPGELVKKSNALARARWSAESVWEPRLVALLASKVRAEDTDFQVYEIHVSELLQKAHSGRDYQEIESVVDKVMSRVLTIRDDKGWTKYNVFSRCRFRRDEGILELGFHPDLKQHYLQLQKNFVKYNLMEFLLLPSIYSQRLFEYLKSWYSEDEHIESISNLHEMLNTPNSFRANFKDFRKWALEKAYKDITKYTDLHFKWEPIKQGRAVVAVRFIFPKKRALPEEQKTQDGTKEEQAYQQLRQKVLDNMQQEHPTTGDTRLIDTVMKCWKEHGGNCSEDHQAEEVCKLCRKVHRHTRLQQASSI